jgi:hypothetical protein
VAQTGEPYAFTGDDPLNSTDPLGLQKGWWIKGNHWHKNFVEGARFLPGEGSRYYVPPTKGRGSPVIVDGVPVDRKGNEWEYAKKSAAHGGAQWDVQHQNGTHTNVYVDGNTRGKINFSGSSGAGSPYDGIDPFDPPSVNRDGTPTEFGITGLRPIDLDPDRGSAGSPVGGMISGESALVGELGGLTAVPEGE